ncbi:hypothetical protein KKA93_01070 [Patescibacteria group bacterium]|nr:hypothetical protein [Patescibacteria group bacterium]MBU1663284.1 hypothetical protein [Patescibacteria group bacterium]MBU1933844.1 hypothetical protein [Patescibacteria group bacterium]MBU2007951.1 hypothetical protein [Patescibacteria group bacterium]MBU2233817.1 hypothetical protein [Patescibacteria group bacterium]
MSDINFLDNKNHDHDHDQKPKDKDNRKEKLAWSIPEKEMKQAKGSKSSIFSFLPFINKKESVDKNFVSAIDKNKLKQSREKVLNLIKHYEYSKPMPKEKDKNKIIALSAFKDKVSKIIKLPQAEEIKPAAVKPPLVQPIIRQEEKSVEVKEIHKEIKIEEKEPIHKNEIKQRVIETNLIQGELVNFFDLRSKVVILASAILMPIFVIGAIYYGLVFYQKSNQVKNLAQTKKFAELEQNIAEEEAGVKEIVGFQARLKTVSQIFAQHLYWTNFFNFLEDNTIKDVYFINFDSDTSGNYIMNALATDYNGIAEQVNIFKNNKKITAVEAEGGHLVAGDDKNKSLVSFILNFTVAKNIFTE